MKEKDFMENWNFFSYMKYWFEFNIFNIFFYVKNCQKMLRKSQKYDIRYNRVFINQGDIK